MSSDSSDSSDSSESSESSDSSSELLTQGAIETIGLDSRSISEKPAGKSKSQSDLSISGIASTDAFISTPTPNVITEVMDVDCLEIIRKEVTPTYAFTGRIFTQTKKRMSKEIGIKVKKSAAIPRMYSAQIEFYFKHLLKTVLRPKLNRGIQKLINSKSNNRHYKVFRVKDAPHSPATAKCFWNKDAILAALGRTYEPRNIDIVDLAAGCKVDPFISDYIKDVEIPIGLTPVFTVPIKQPRVGSLTVELHKLCQSLTPKTISNTVKAASKTAK